MRILFINPNTTAEFTTRIQTVAEQYRLPSTEVVALNPERGPRSIECVYDEMLSVPGTIEIGIRELEQADGIAIACYSDHAGIYALRELGHSPVLGIAEASMYMACMLGHRFSIVTTGESWLPLLWDAVRRYGLESRCASVRTTHLSVLDQEEASPADVTQLILDESRRALDEDGAEVICLGCASMTGMDKELEEVLGVPVLDGVICALKLLEAFAGYGLKTSKRRAYALPTYQPLDGLPQRFEDMYGRP
jgi:allantoin racemase